MRGHDNAAEINSIANMSFLDTPQRVFRHAGKHEAKHIAFGLDLWYTANVIDHVPEESIHMLQLYTSAIHSSSVEPLVRLFAPTEVERKVAEASEGAQPEDLARKLVHRSRPPYRLAPRRRSQRQEARRRAARSASY